MLESLNQPDCQLAATQYRLPRKSSRSDNILNNHTSFLSFSSTTSPESYKNGSNRKFRRNSFGSLPEFNNQIFAPVLPKDIYFSPQPVCENHFADEEIMEIMSCQFDCDDGLDEIMALKLGIDSSSSESDDDCSSPETSPIFSPKRSFPSHSELKLDRCPAPDPISMLGGEQKARSCKKQRITPPPALVSSPFSPPSIPLLSPRPLAPPLNLGITTPDQKKRCRNILSPRSAFYPHDNLV
eukprot:TRINITY_DN13695_c0_g1_i1.p1 TRINITY_DN13695_c0_g1~~TRINITY_DN13695_c0_g1_i1.p1  ORF type:complete len:240 (+),score=45.35 TRINITY_DN13695_c0_g1_i1:49-768(+)